MAEQTSPTPIDSAVLINGGAVTALSDQEIESLLQTLPRDSAEFDIVAAEYLRRDPNGDTDPVGPITIVGAGSVAPTETAEQILQQTTTSGLLRQAQEQASLQQQYNQTTQRDWRVRISLLPGATYLYRAADAQGGILAPLVPTNGVVFPYVPTVNTNYQAKYDNYELTHSNIRGYFYRNSMVSDITVTGTFTAQNTQEAQYLLAVIHFFRSVTKMFYGQDPERGTPPPLVTLNGFGEYQYNNHTCLISNFAYNLPNNVDYIRVNPNNLGLSLAGRRQTNSSNPFTISSIINRITNAGLPRGAEPGRADLGVTGQTVSGTAATTYVPTRIDLTVTMLPVQTRSQVSQQFSLRNFANGNLLRGGFW